MNCTDARARLSAFVYGDLPADEAFQVREHLASCSGCQREHAALGQVRCLLDAVPALAVPSDLSRLYREAAAEQARRSRRWRRLAIATLAAAAAVVLAVLLSRLEVRLDEHQIVVRWGAVPAPREAPAPPVPLPQPEAPLVAQSPPGAEPETEQQLRLLSELVQALAADTDQRDERRQRELTRLQEQIQGLQQQMTQLRIATEKDVSALYAAQFPER